MSAKFLDREQAQSALAKTGKHFVIIQNPDYIEPAHDVVPLAEPTATPLRAVKAVVMDMDGTTTTTETLCLHALEYMVRSVTGRIDQKSWSGLDKEKDYPHVIGNSTTRHVEYLIETYWSSIQGPALKKAFLRAAMWFLIKGRDEQRIAEVRHNLKATGLHNLLQDPELQNLWAHSHWDEQSVDARVGDYAAYCRCEDKNAIVRAAIDIYYQRYHEILGHIERGEGASIAEDLLGDAGKRLIEPMPAVGLFLAMIKGWLENDEVVDVVEHLITGKEIDPMNANYSRLKALNDRFRRHPIKLALVTSSIAYEANIVMQEVLRVLQEQIRDWPLDARRKKILNDQFARLDNLYDGFVTASDSSEIRLKPHRDLYSLALHQMGVSKSDFDKVIGFEDSESGTVAIRAAGVGLCVALPFSDTRHHRFDAATHVCQGGLPQAILQENLFTE
ncbi:MAG: hypothetical protein GF313_14310 [Caldithrix sp.]|nr:hypothetical protein [Caldithrix sp.]